MFTLDSEAYSWILRYIQIGGYLGVFLVSVVGNIIPFLPIPYLSFIFFYNVWFPDSSPLLIGLISGLGGGIGKLAVYFASYYGASKLLPPRKQEQLNAFKTLLGNYGALALFLLAATPSPDDVLVTILGIAKYSITKFFLAITSGKIVISLLTAYFGKAFSFLISEENLLVSVLASIIIFLILTWFILSIDWIKVFQVVQSEGWKGFLNRLAKNGLKEFKSEKNNLSRMVRGKRKNKED